jgi:hypothetical protein
VLVLDTETTIDATQRMLFGSYRYCRWSDGLLVCVAEGLIYADELPREDPKGLATLKRYVARRRADVGAGVSTGLHLYSRHAFIERVFYPSVCLSGAIVCGLNLPFDLSRLAVECGEARGPFFYGGFSFSLADYVNKTNGQRHDDTFFARVAIKPLDSKRAFIRFTGGRERHKGQRAAGRFLDLRTLSFALTNASHSLASACNAFDVVHPKQHAAHHGRITAKYIDYNRRDVLASQELLERLRAAYDVHPIELDPCKAYSPASIAKAYLRAFGVAEPAQQFKAVADRYLGFAMSTYFGGRAEVKVRDTGVPVVYTDFLSMYPTVNGLMNLWALLTAERIDVVDATSEVRAKLQSVSRANLFRKATWRSLAFFAEVEPDADILPVRARYGEETPAWNIGVNPLHSAHPLWYAGPDVIASRFLSGKVPKIRRAFRLVPVGQQSTLTPQLLASRIRLDPRAQDMFRALIEERKQLKGRRELSQAERDRLDQFLKVVANAGSYGIFAEMNASDRPKKAKRVALRVFSRERPFDVETSSPEDMGKYCFPPIAALIPSAARLMLARLVRHGLNGDRRVEGGWPRRVFRRTTHDQRGQACNSGVELGAGRRHRPKVRPPFTLQTTRGTGVHPQNRGRELLSRAPATTLRVRDFSQAVRALYTRPARAHPRRRQWVVGARAGPPAQPRGRGRRRRVDSRGVGIPHRAGTRAKPQGTRVA